MARDWIEQFKRWAKPPSDTEEQKGKNAASMIREAIREDSVLSGKNIDVYATGSYRNNTNVRLSSDIDVAIVLRDSFFGSYPDGGPTREQLGFTDAKYSYGQFRDDVGQALRAKFGAAGVSAGNKSYDIHANSYRLDADAAVFLEHRRYTGKNVSGRWHYLEGVELRPRNAPSTRVINWHQQHYDKGVAKNTATNRRYKRVARILKNLKNEMAESGVEGDRTAANGAPSFLLECLAWNAPNERFNQEDGSYYKDVESVIGWLWHQTKPAADEPKFTEVSGLKWLFAPSQPWTRVQAHAFVDRAWKYAGFSK